MQPLHQKFSKPKSTALLCQLLCPHFLPCLDTLPVPQGGSDVITRTANKRINWGSYKINSSSDKVRAHLDCQQEDQKGGSLQGQLQQCT